MTSETKMTSKDKMTFRSKPNFDHFMTFFLNQTKTIKPYILNHNYATQRFYRFPQISLICENGPVGTIKWTMGLIPLNAGETYQDCFVRMVP